MTRSAGSRKTPVTRFNHADFGSAIRSLHQVTELRGSGNNHVRLVSAPIHDQIRAYDREDSCR